MKRYLFLAVLVTMIFHAPAPQLLPAAIAPTTLYAQSTVAILDLNGNVTGSATVDETVYNSCKPVFGGNVRTTAAYSTNGGATYYQWNCSNGYTLYSCSQHGTCQ